MRLISSTLALAQANALSLVVQIQLSKALAQALNALVDALKDKAQHALSPQDAQAFKEAVAFCDILGPQLVSQCVNSINRGLALKHRYAQQSLSDAEEQALDQLLVDRVVGNVRETLAEYELDACSCFSQLVGQPVVNAENPFSLDYLVPNWLKAFDLSSRPEPVRDEFLAQMCAVLPQSLFCYFKALSEQCFEPRITDHLSSSGTNSFLRACQVMQPDSPCHSAPIDGPEAIKGLDDEHRQALQLILDGLNGLAPEELPPASQITDGVLRTVQDLVGNLCEEIAYAHSHDDLTGLLNRRSFEAVVAKSLYSAEEVAYIAVQVDQLSLLNNQLGLMAGDACLNHVAQLLQRMLPNNGVLARLSGVKFAAMVQQHDEVSACVLAERMRTCIGQKRFIWQGQSLGVTLSVGVMQAAAGDDVGSVFSQLSTVCSLAKESGGNRVCRHSVLTDDARVGLLAIAVRVDEIIMREDLSLRVQQIARADIKASEIPHYELLLVMENGLALHDFIAAAERYKLMGKIDRWVLINAFSQIENTPSLWQRCASISINLSGNSLNDEDLLGFIKGLFNHYAIDPRRICFEITETTAVANLSQAAELIRQLQTLGCKFALDDFGVGFSSYEYLKYLPVDIVKIDGIFVREIVNSAHDLAIVRSINEVAHALGRITVAEYVENREVWQLLAEIGVDFVQGYGVQRPRSFQSLLSGT
ncbi:EAL domain-containing protein [Pseudomonas sp. NPDC078700]|uniref:EAL domain-containing protein n=1 Tax=Pseudomonas sp. NPDC078700 TaxID=3364424 RepID=UPI0037C5D168